MGLKPKLAALANDLGGDRLAVGKQGPPLGQLVRQTQGSLWSKEGNCCHRPPCVVRDGIDALQRPAVPSGWRRLVL